MLPEVFQGTNPCSLLTFIVMYGAAGLVIRGLGHTPERLGRKLRQDTGQNGNNNGNGNNGSSNGNRLTTCCSTSPCTYTCQDASEAVTMPHVVPSHFSALFTGMELGMQDKEMATTMAMQIRPTITAMTTAMSQLVTTMVTTTAMGQGSRHQPASMLAMATIMVRICPALPHLWPLHAMPNCKRLIIHDPTCYDTPISICVKLSGSSCRSFQQWKL